MFPCLYPVAMWATSSPWQNRGGEGANSARSEQMRPTGGETAAGMVLNPDGESSLGGKEGGLKADTRYASGSQRCPP